MKKFLTIVIIILHSVLLFSQNDRKINRQGYKDYMEGDYSEAEIKFRTAEDVNEKSFEARFNTGASLYEQEKYEETIEHYQTVINEAKDPESLSKVWHNIGNTLLESQKYAESIDAYKNSLRLNAQDMDTKYNLAYAMQKLQEQQQQEQNQDQQNQDQNKDQENQEQKDQENQEQKDQEQQDQNKDQQDQEQQNQDQQDEQEQEQKEQEQQAVPHQLSEEDAERMLEAIMQQEKDVKDKVDKKKAAARKVKTEKDW